MRPANAVLAVEASSSGRSSSPEAVADAPVTTWKKTGMKTITAKSESVAQNSAALTIVNTGLANSRSGRIGSAARRCWTSQAPKSATAPIASPTISAESQAYSWPPHVVNSSRQVSAPASRAAPR